MKVVSSLGFQKTLMLSLVSVSLIATLFCGGASYLVLDSVLRTQIDESLDARLKGVEAAFQIARASAAAGQNLLMDRAWSSVGSHFSVSKKTVLNWKIENPSDHLKTDVQISPIVIDGASLSDHKFVDGLSKQFGGSATVFALTDVGLIRVSTTLKRADGERAIQTLIPASTPVVKSIRDGKRFVGLAPVLGEIFVASYEPILEEGRVVGALFLGHKEIAIDALKAELKSEKVLETGYFYILDSAGKFILHPAKEGENVLGKTDLDGRKIFNEILEAKSGQIHYRWLNAATNSAQNKIAIFRTLPEIGWTVAVSLNESEALAPLRRLQMVLGWVVVALSVAMLILSYFIGRPMAKMLNEIAAQISKAVESCSSDSMGIRQVAQTLAAAVTQQAAAMQETMSAVEEIRTTIQGNASSAEGATSAATRLSESSVRGQASIGHLTEAIGAISDGNQSVSRQVNASYQEIEKILDLISQIEGKTAVIHEIVFQTRLLSFNASVEAARAGENGKGFAVVAEEIGRLAVLSGKSAVEIQETLIGSRAEVENIVATAKKQVKLLVEDSSVKVESGVKLARDCREDFDLVAGEGISVQALVDQISTASSEQAKGIEDICKAMNEIETATQQNAVLAEKSDLLSTGLQQSADALQFSSDGLRVFLKGA